LKSKLGTGTLHPGAEHAQESKWVVLEVLAEWNNNREVVTVDEEDCYNKGKEEGSE